MVMDYATFGVPIAVEGTYNLRDIGGYPATGGRQTAHGVLFRSDALGGLTVLGRETLAALSLRLILDLRSEPEVAGQSCALGPLGIETRNISVLRAAAPSEQGGRSHTLDRLYRLMVDRRGEYLASALRAVVQSSGPVLVHCTAGKDRTGVLVALALEIAGVEREAIITDYAASERNLAGEWATAMLPRLGARWALPEESIREIVTTSPAATMRTLLTHLDEAYGGSAAYLRAQGMSLEELSALRDRLTVTLG